MDSNLLKRVTFAAVAIPVALGVVWNGGLPLAFLLAVAGVLGTRELFDLAARQGIHAARGIGIFTAALFAPVAYATIAAPDDVGRAVLDGWMYVGALWLLLTLSWAVFRRGPQDKPLAAVAVTLIAPLYAAGLPAFLIGIRHAHFGERSLAGASLVFFPLVLTWVCDTAAMFAGRAIGGPKLAPTVSPGKTWAGSIAGVVGALVVAPGYTAWVLAGQGVTLSLWQGLVCAAVLSVIGQVGDLVESLFKREVGVKDSSNLIPGHGGVLDRFDSLYFVLPVAAVLYHLFGLI